MAQVIEEQNKSKSNKSKSNKMKLNSIGWNEDDINKNIAQKQNFLKINMFNFKHELVSDLEKQLKIIEYNRAQIKKHTSQLKEMKDKNMKKDYKDLYSEYDIYLERIQERIKAALVYITKTNNVNKISSVQTVKSKRVKKV